MKAYQSIEDFST